MEVMALPNDLRFHFGTAGENWTESKGLSPVSTIGRSQQFECPRGCAHDQGVKDIYYLIDNMSVLILSRIESRSQEESGWAADAFPKWESSTRSVRKRTREMGENIVDEDAPMRNSAPERRPDSTYTRMIAPLANPPPSVGSSVPANGKS